MFRENSCNAIVSVGGGSAIDVAKCIKLYCNMNDNVPYLEQEIVANDIPFGVVPTTAGTGSEATRFAVIYYNGEKQSVAHESCIPDTVLFDTSVLDSLPVYQKKVTMMDAFCHGVESYWSVNSTDESKAFSREALELVLKNMDSYLLSEKEAGRQMLKAAYIAGKAINITQTTAGHAMCYKLTGFYDIPHGHGAALCVAKLWPYMINHTEKCVDSRGREYLSGVFDELAKVLGEDSALGAADKFQRIVDKLGLTAPMAEKGDYKMLKVSVNPVRLKNNPVKLYEEDIDYLYHQILRGE